MGQCSGKVKRANPEAQDDALRMQETLDGLFPNFKPLTPEAPQWEHTTPSKCLECSHDMDFLSGKVNCRSCGRIFCDRCCYARPAIHNEKICGICMGGAMAALRRRELSNLETRARRNSELRKRNSQLTQRGNSNTAAGDGATPSKTDSTTGALPAADEPEVVLSITDVVPEVSAEQQEQQQQQQATESA